MRISDGSADVVSSDLAAIHPLGKHAHALAVIPEQLDQIAPLAPKGEQRAGMRALLQNLLRHHRQAVEALAHVRRAASQEYPRRWRQRDHRARTPITRDSASASTVASTLTLMPDGSSIPITPSLRAATVGAGKARCSLICTCANAGSIGLRTPVSSPDIACRRHV